jgi:hypothetical protein
MKIKLYNIYWELIGYRLRNFISSFKNIIRWFPIIWKDRDWDQDFIWEILKFKLSNQADYISKKDRHTRAQKDAKNMRLCVKLIKLCQDDYYSMEYMDYAKDRVWWTESEERPDCSVYNSEVIYERYDDLFKKYKLIHERVVLGGEGPFSLNERDGSGLKRVIAMNICHINQKRAQDLLFKIMNENINCWWD